MRLRTYHEAQFEDLQDAIKAYHAEGYLSDSQRDKQYDVLDRLFKLGYGIQRVRREFAKNAPKGEATLRYLDQNMGGTTPSNTVADIDWLCNQRMGLSGYVLDSIRPDVQDYKAPFADELYVFKSCSGHVLAILDDR